MRFHIIRICFLIFLLSLVLEGCILFSNHKVKLLTNRPEICAYVEVFNASQDTYRVEVQYASEPLSLLLGKGDPADILIGEGLARPSAMKKCESLNSLFTNNSVSPDSFYPEILKLGILDKDQKVLPLNFNLPCIMYNKNMETNVLSDIFINLETMKSSCLEYNSMKSNRLTRMGFSPLWDNEFMYLTARLFGTDFKRGTDTFLTWNTDALLKATAFLKDWIEKIPGGLKAERIFSKKYLSTPGYQLIKEKQILYFFFNSRELYTIPQEKFEYLDFRWLTYDNKIPVHDNILFIGIPHKSTNKKGGKAFISWIFDPAIQDKLLEINHFKKLDSVFGLARGFSSLKEVNITSLPRHYPLLVNHIPLSDSLIFPGQFPDNWQRIKEENIKTWLYSAVTTENFDKKLEDQLNFFQE